MTHEWIVEHIAGGGGGVAVQRKALLDPQFVRPARAEGVGVDVRIVNMNAPLADLHGEILAPAGDSDLWIVGGGNVASQFADGGYSMRWP